VANLDIANGAVFFYLIAKHVWIRSSRRLSTRDAVRSTVAAQNLVSLSNIIGNCTQKAEALANWKNIYEYTRSFRVLGLHFMLVRTLPESIAYSNGERNDWLTKYSDGLKLFKDAINNYPSMYEKTEQNFKMLQDITSRFLYSRMVIPSKLTNRANC